MSSAQVRPMSSTPGPMHESASFTAHLKTLERTIALRARYENFIGGQWVAPLKGGYFDNISPTTGQVICQIARSQAEDIDRALDAAHAAADGWGRTAVAERARILNRVADRMEQYLPFLAAVETYDNGKPIRETNLADLPLAVDHFRYFASCVRAQEGSLGELDDDTVAYHYHEPLGVVGQIIPWNFPILMAVWKLAPALAAGNAVVIKPAEQTPMSLLVLAELVADILPPGVLNIVNGFGLEAGKPLASSARIAKIAFTGETTTGRLIMQYASENIIPVTLELGASRRTSSSRTCCARRTISWTRRWRVLRCLPSIRARCVPAPRALWCSARSMSASWSGRSSGWRAFARATPLR